MANKNPWNGNRHLPIASGTRPISVQTHCNMILQTNTLARPDDEYNTSGGLIKNLV
jgi:hypothetical protein